MLRLKKWMACAGMTGLVLVFVAHIAALTNRLSAQQAPAASPVEQFQLEGAYHILSRENTGRAAKQRQRK